MSPERRADRTTSASQAPPQFLEIPGKATVWRTTDLPPRRIELPYLGRTPRWRMLILLVLGLPLIPLAWIVSPLFLIAAVLNFDEAPFRLLQVLLGLTILLPFLTISSEDTFITLRGAFHRGYHAGLDAEKFWHFQLDDPIAFNTIKRLEVFCFRADQVVLRITTDQHVRLRFSSLFNRRKSAPRSSDASRFTFSPKIMAGEKTLLPDAISHLVLANGGLVERKEVLSLWKEILLPWL